MKPIVMALMIMTQMKKNPIELPLSHRVRTSHPYETSPISDPTESASVGVSHL